MAHGFPTEFDSLITGLNPALTDLPCLLAIAAKEDGGISLDPIVLFAAEEAMNGLLEIFPLQIPQGHVHRAHGADCHRTAAEIHRATVHLLPEPLRLERVLTHQDLAQAAGDGMAVRRVNDGLDHFRRRVCFADAFQPIVGAHADQHDVLTTGGLPLDGFDA